MRVNVYAEEMTDRVEIISKEIDVRQIERSRPKGAPEHAWPRFPDYERHPTEIGRAPAWWSLYVLDEHWPIVVEVHVPSHKDLTGMTPREIRMVDPGPCRRVFHGTSREAAEAAFRLLCTTQARDTDR